MKSTYIGPAVDMLDGEEIGLYYVYNDVSDGYGEGEHYIRLLVFENDLGERQHTFEKFIHCNRENGDEAFGSTPMIVAEHLPPCERDEGLDAAEDFMMNDYPLLLSGELEFDPI